ncbi:bifunctional adenosylcobinamide kinase/adenosylcobinamide-phosphate guanylyltransferase [Bacillus sp. ISL-45]|uniref:bifunctional adenosylcobinamide kinase/adenosylcobinamide-phosphate guanylyltransferase n=1 Tax=Bacillus sp. ISL-45 TaxID=2819128 RepID=UPI001BE62C36|nr:bifunctional adenosylcobinamide kinase/adenosylcobinamide-phosphate guanylyltransferase [Bacillus sp. ISL-45]MBT2663266.1 bifunctional adenosylcobinamide kinase/adenosylcobinamide-phosphate guanylyltransferase [Bacillus sp. ISL-45]
MAGQSSLIFISGGVRSGKSRFAEILAGKSEAKYSGQLHYVAAGQPSDHEMKERIMRHQQDRELSGLNWRTWEIPRNLSPFSTVLTKNDIVLLDCLTTLLNNEFFHEDGQWECDGFPEMIVTKIMNELNQVTQQARTFIVVSNEVHGEAILDEGLVFTYAKVLGQLHQAIVKEADYAYLVEAGVPIMMKGEGSP